MFFHHVHFDGRHHDVIAVLFRPTENVVIHCNLIETKGYLLLYFVTDNLAHLVLGHGRQCAAACEHRLAGNSNHGLTPPNLCFFQRCLQCLHPHLPALLFIKRGIGIVFVLDIFGDLIPRFSLGEFTDAYRTGTYIQDQTFFQA